MRQVLLIAVGVMGAVALVVGIFTFFQAGREELSLSADLQYRTRVLADSVAESVESPLAQHSTSSVQRVVDRVAANERIVGLGVFAGDGSAVARSAELPESVYDLRFIVGAMDSDTPAGEFVAGPAGRVYVFVYPLHYNDSVIGALVMAQSAQYIDAAIGGIWRDNIVRLFLQLFFIGLALYGLVRFVFYKPLSAMTELIRATRRGESVDTGEVHSLLRPLSSEIGKLSTNLRQARIAASEEARMRLQKLDSPWTAERLREFIQAYLKERPIFVVSNREPYVHSKTKSGIEVSVPAGGVVTALEPVMEATGGMWIAHGSGTADQDVVDEDDTIAVPPEEHKYTLKRIWLTEKEVQGYYSGFSNEALWPLCHMAHVRPMFKADDWQMYRKVNGLFAKTVLQEIKNVERPLILVQDYQLALLPELIKKSRPDAQVALFWHIPWPSAAQFSICPWRKEILQGMLGADLMGFHTQQYCNNFIDTVGAEVESLIDYEQFGITRGGHRTVVKPFPLSIAFSRDGGESAAPDRSTLDALSINTEFVGLGVDRLDYTKGILERFKGIEFFLDSHEEYREKFTFLQIASPSREGVEKYREYAAQVTAEAERVNQKFGTRGWKPIVLEKKNYPQAKILPLYRLANVCLVTSLHDGMNLVAKEYVAARDDERGALVLSQFAGASQDLKGALVVNPYSAESTAAAIASALAMPPAEQYRRMKTMRAAVRDYNVYRWSAELIKTLTQLD